MGLQERRARRRRQRATIGGADPLAVVVLGRVGRKKSGGIGRSAVLIGRALESLGNIVEFRSVLAPLADLPPRTDLVWHYGDYDAVEQQAQFCRRAGVPMLVNSNYDGTDDRRRWVHELARRTGAYLAMFTHSVRDDSSLSRLRERIVVVPKTIRAGTVDTPFEERSGIAVGEFGKLRRERLVRGIDVDRAIGALRSALPGAPLYAYDQYATSNTPAIAGVDVVRPGADIMQWLSRRRLCVSLSRFETFAMVPAEAQSVGTPVLYRPMIQGLSEQLGQTALAFDSADDLALQARFIYDDEERWRAVSDAGRQNALARCTGASHVALDMALRKLVARPAAEHWT